MLILLGDVQIPLLAALLIGGCLTKAVKVVRTRTVAAGLGPTALFPLKLRAPVAVFMCVIELCLGIGLIATSTGFGGNAPAGLIRLGAGLLFLVATFALIELRSVQPDVGCGCFGEFSQTPVTGRTIARSALLAVAALATMKVGPITVPRWPAQDVVLLLMLVAELVVIGFLSPEIRHVLVRIGYSAPCEQRVVNPEQSLSALHRSAQWRKHSALIAGADPSDIWRELCWRYIAFPSKHAGKDAQLVFAVRLEHRRPVVLSTLVDTASGTVLPWPTGASRRARTWRRGTSGIRRPERLRDAVPQAEGAGMPSVGRSDMGRSLPPI
jgi:hypothetical protein